MYEAIQFCGYGVGYPARRPVRAVTKLQPDACDADHPSGWL